MILVTGGTGLVGSHLLLKLAERGERVRAVCRRGSRLEMVKKLFTHYQQPQLFSSIEWVEADVLDYYSLHDNLKDVSTVYHCAAMVSFDPRLRDEMYAINVEGTANLVNASKEAGVKRFCYVSSIATLGKSKNEHKIDEDSFWQADDNHSVYSQSKFHSEMEVWRGAREGLSTIVVNPSVIIGPGDSHRSTGMLLQTLSNDMRFYTGGSSGFVDVRDVVESMIRLCDSDVENERYLLNGENLSYKQLMDKAARVFDVKAPSVKASRFLTGVAWRVEKLKYWFLRKAPRMTRETARSSQNTSAYSNDKVRKELDFIFRSVEDALENVAEFIR